MPRSKRRIKQASNPRPKSPNDAAELAANVRRADRQDLAGGLVAGGTVLPRASNVATPALPRKILLTIEMLLLFGGVPLLMLLAITTYEAPLFIVLQPVLLAFIAFLFLDPSFRLRTEFTRVFSWSDLASILIIFVMVGLAVVAFVAQELPDRFLGFPTRRPETWRLVMVLYPILSVVTQELVYRTFFFHRYGPLFGQDRALMIFTNGLIFGFGHVIFGNWVAVGGTALAGMLFAYRYESTRSFWAVWFEHTLWGWLVFTVGLGGFFFTGYSNFRGFGL